MAMRGLTVFISDLRNCPNQEAEQKRVEKEMAKIRGKFTTSRPQEGYQKKKYVWKMIYMHMLGYEVDFGHMEAVNLVTSPRYTEKAAGYFAISTLLTENSEILRLITNSVRADLLSKNDAFQCMALTAVANVGGAEFAENLMPDVQKLLLAHSSRPSVKKKAALCVLRLYRKNPTTVTADQWAPRLSAILEERHVGVLTAVLSLTQAIVAADPAGYEELAIKVVRLLVRLALNREVSNDYCYYLTPSPWLQVKCLKLLQSFPAPEHDRTAMSRLCEVLSRVLTKTEVTKSVNKNNADHGILFEAVNLIIHYDFPPDNELRAQATNLLGRFISVREPNIRYLGLETMSRLAALTDASDLLKKHQSTILFSLKDADISIRRRALDLLYAMCDRSNAEEIVNELIQYLTTADFNIREELVLKIAILAEKFAPDFRWYIDVVLKLVLHAGDFVSDDIWFRVTQIVTGFEEGANNEDLQRYSAGKVFDALDKPHVHETMVKIGAYILGEFGHLICEEAGKSGTRQLAVLHQHFPLCAPATRAMMLTSYVKLSNLYPDLRDQVHSILQQHADFIDPDIQQRAVEYLRLMGEDGAPLMQSVLEMMPTFSEKTQHNSLLIRRIRKLTVAEPSETRARSASAAPRPDQDEDGSPRESEAYQSRRGESAPARAESVPAIIPKPARAVSSTEAPDLLDMEEPAAAKPASIMDEYDPLSAPAPALAPAHAMTPQQLFRALCVAQEGPLLDDPRLQLAVKAEYHLAVGRLILTFTNPGATTITNLQTSVAPTPALRIQLSALPPQIPPRAQVQQFLQVECMQPFPEPPTLSVQFLAGASPVQLALPLPIVLSKFVEPHQLDGATFLRFWNELAGAPREVQVAGHVQPQFLPLSGAAFHPLLANGFRLGVLSGVDPSPNNVCAVGTFNTNTPAPNGKKISVACMVRIETNPERQAVRVTVRTAHGQVSQVLCNLLMAHFAVAAA